MATLDAAEFARLAVRLNLITDDQRLEVLEELTDDESAQAVARLLTRKGYMTDWQVSKLLKDDPDGLFLGGYRVLYKISAGTFGRVYRGDDPQTGAQVAIKVLRRRWLEDPKKVELFEREGKVGLSIQHPNIVQVLAVNKDPKTGQHFIVMEFVEGGNLRDILAIRRKLEPDEVMRILEETTLALSHAYSRGLTHRDIKLSNILLSTSGQAKLVDFGLATFAEGTALDHGEMLDRTVEYAGLERNTRTQHGDIRSDLFFLGCVVFEMLTGEHLMTVERHRRKRMIRQDFEIDQTVRPRLGKTVPPKMISLIERMVAFDPNERFQTPEEMLEVIRSIRAEMRGDKAADQRGEGPPSVFVIEQHSKLQNIFREKLKEHGYRAFISLEPQRALERLQHNPFDALIFDAEPIGIEGPRLFEQIMRSAEMKGIDLIGILILGEDQGHWSQMVQQRPNTSVLVRPLTLKHVLEPLKPLLSAASG